MRLAGRISKIRSYQFRSFSRSLHDERSGCKAIWVRPARGNFLLQQISLDKVVILKSPNKYGDQLPVTPTEAL